MSSSWVPKVGCEFDEKDQSEKRSNSSSDVDDDEKYRNSRNDNPGTLNGVAPYYVAPQHICPSFFQPVLTTAMFEVKTSYENRKN